MKLLVFDWDGTLFDSTANIVHAIVQSVADLGLPSPSEEQARWVIGLGLSEALAHIAPDLPPAQRPLLNARYLYHYAQGQEKLQFFAGVDTMLSDLSAQGFLLAIATGKSRRGLNSALAQMPTRNLFQTSRTADETAGKPHPQMLYEVMEELACSPEETLMIGDTSHDLQLARNAGCQAVAVTYGAHSTEELRSYQPRYIAETVQQLHQYLTTLETAV